MFKDVSNSNFACYWDKEKKVYTFHDDRRCKASLKAAGVKKENCYSSFSKGVDFIFNKQLDTSLHKILSVNERRPSCLNYSLFRLISLSYLADNYRFSNDVTKDYKEFSTSYKEVLDQCLCSTLVPGNTWLHCSQINEIGEEMLVKGKLDIIRPMIWGELKKITSERNETSQLWEHGKNFRNILKSIYDPNASKYANNLEFKRDIFRRNSNIARFSIFGLLLCDFIEESQEVKYGYKKTFSKNIKAWNYYTQSIQQEISYIKKNDKGQNTRILDEFGRELEKVSDNKYYSGKLQE